MIDDRPVSHRFKVVVAGSFAVGKSTLIRMISDTEVVGTEAPTSGLESVVKDTTTVGMEYGTLSIEGDGPPIELQLHGLPGQERFRFMWDIVSNGADGFLLITDATKPETWPETREMARYLQSLSTAPIVLAINRAGGDPALVADVVAGIDVAGIPSIACEVVDPSSAREALVEVLIEVLDHLDEAAPIPAPAT